jgi:hypothetical protein
MVIKACAALLVVPLVVARMGDSRSIPRPVDAAVASVSGASAEAAPTPVAVAQPRLAAPAATMAPATRPAAPTAAPTAATAPAPAIVGPFPGQTVTPPAIPGQAYAVCPADGTWVCEGLWVFDRLCTYSGAHHGFVTLVIQTEHRFSGNIELVRQSDGAVLLFPASQLRLHSFTWDQLGAAGTTSDVFTAHRQDRPLEPVYLNEGQGPIVIQRTFTAHDC